MAVFLQGINPVISFFAILLLAAISLLIAWWSYSSLQQLSRVKKNTLICLRALSLLILVFLLLNPFITRNIDIDNTPRIAVYLDNSQSLSITRGEYSGLDTYNSLLESFISEKNDDIEFDLFLFDHVVTEGAQPDVTGTITNVQNVLEHYRENENNYRAAVLFSDGIVTQGRNPLFSAQNISTPIISVPVGDTSTVRDISIAEIQADESTYTFTNQIIRVEIQQQGFENDNTTMSVYRNGERIFGENISFTTSQSSHIIEFPQQFEDPGIYTFEIVLSEKEEEFTAQNNRRTFTIEVQDDKTIIVSVAFEIHPDVSSIRRLIATDQQYELYSANVLSNERIVGDNPLDLDIDPDLVIIHGFNQMNTSITQWLRNGRFPQIVASLPKSYQSVIDNELYPDIIPYRFQSPPNPIQIQINNFLSENPHPILDVPMVNFQRLPQLISADADYGFTALSEVLFRANYQGETTTIPLVVVEESANRRMSVINAYNWFRFEQHVQPEVQNLFKGLFSNIISWTAASPNRDNLLVEPVRDSYNENEEVVVRAILQNELDEPENDALIDINIFERDTEEPLRSFRMIPQQNGIYTAELGQYPNGLYRVEARATKDGQTIGSDQTVINIGESVAEFLHTKRNDQLLSQLAETTRGIYIGEYNFNRAYSFIDELLSEEIEASETDVEFYYLYRSGFWFILILILLSSEWLIRRNSSLP